MLSCLVAALLGLYGPLAAASDRGPGPLVGTGDGTTTAPESGEPSSKTWATTFDPARLKGHLPDADPMITVVNPVKSDRAVAEALTAALEDAGISRVTSIDGIAPPELDDTTIVRRVFETHHVHGVVAIIRVLRNDAGEEETAVVVLYDAKGELLSGFAGVIGTPIDAGNVAQSGAEGLGTQAMTAVSQVVEESSRPRARRRSNNADKTYFQVQGGGRQFRVYKGLGPHKRRVSTADFLYEVGQRDLGDAQSKRAARRRGLLISGAVLGGLGVTTALVSGIVYLTSSDDTGLGALVAGSAFAVAGISLMAGSNAFKGNVIDARRANRFANGHNERERRKQDGSNRSASLSHRRTAPFLAHEASFGIMVLRGGAALALGGSF